MRRGFATFLALWIVAMAGVFVAAIQWTALTHGASGHERLARVRASWAARAGVEATIARLADATLNPDESDAFRVMRAMQEVAQGSLPNATWSIVHQRGAEIVPGPVDAHATMHVARMTRESLMYVPYMTEPTADAILDWMDEDDDVRQLGAEAGYYMGAEHPCHPRNAPMRTITELALVAGMDPWLVRGDDQNLDTILEPGQDAGWSSRLTAASIDGAAWTISGEERLDLTTASSADVQARLGVSDEQAEAIIAYAGIGGARPGDFVRQQLSALAAPPATEERDRRTSQEHIPDLTREQITLLLQETSIGESTPEPGRLNINTASREALECVPGLSLEQIDAVIADRAARAGGYASLMDLLDVEGFNRVRVGQLVDTLCVRSNVYIVHAVGRDSNSGVQVHVACVLDRSHLPITIREITIR